MRYNTRSTTRNKGVTKPSKFVILKYRHTKLSDTTKLSPSSPVSVTGDSSLSSLSNSDDSTSAATDGTTPPPQLKRKGKSKIIEAKESSFSPEYSMVSNDSMDTANLLLKMSGYSLEQEVLWKSTADLIADTLIEWRRRWGMLERRKKELQKLQRRAERQLKNQVGTDS